MPKKAWSAVAAHGAAHNHFPHPLLSTPPRQTAVPGWGTHGASVGSVSASVSASASGSVSAGGFVDVAALPSWGMQSAHQLRRATDAAVFSHYAHSAEINSKVVLWQGDIVKLQVDGIVNAANSSLRGMMMCVISHDMPC